MAKKRDGQAMEINNLPEVPLMPLTLSSRTYYRAAEACKIAGTNRITFLGWVRDGKFPDVEHRDRKGWRLFTVDDIDRLRAEVNQVIRLQGSRSTIKK